MSVRRLICASLLVCLLFGALRGARLEAARDARAAAGTTDDHDVLMGAQSRIEIYRMGDLVVRVYDRRGRPLKNAAVNVEQTRHAFLFGSNAFLLNPHDTSPRQLAYQQRLAALFNYATLPFYWGTFEREQGSRDYQRLEEQARWCAAHGLERKGHPLVWHEIYPRWAPGEPDAAIPLLRERVTDLITHYKGLINIWDVVNEANVAAEFKNGVGHWAERDGAAEMVQTVFSWARAARGDESETFIYNDYEVGPKNVGLLTELTERKSLPDAIGLQSHMHRENLSLSNVWNICQTFSKFGRPLHFTETTVISGPRRQFDYHGRPATDWLTTPEGEAEQAEYVEKFYTVLFSHPSVQAITWWDLSDEGAWLGAPAGLLRRDMSPKPAYDKLMSLIHGKWWTRVAGRTGADGEYRTRAFLGSYSITIRTSKATRTVPVQVSRNEDGRTVLSVKM